MKTRIKCSSDIPNAVSEIQRDLYNLLSNETSNRRVTYPLSKKLLLWLDVWLNRYLPNEQNFEYKNLMIYSRGMVVFANLGFKVGSEEGGLHYALVVENDNATTNKTVTVIPLRSLELTENPLDIDEKHEVFLGYGIFKDEITKAESQLEKTTDPMSKRVLLERIENYKKGSVALVNQICALSKMRIYCPKNENDELASFKLDSSGLHKVDIIMKRLYTKKSFRSNLSQKVRIFFRRKQLTKEDVGI